MIMELNVGALTTSLGRELFLGRSCVIISTDVEMLVNLFFSYALVCNDTFW